MAISTKVFAIGSVTGLLILLLLPSWLITVTWAQTDYQSVLLDFYTRQLVAHGSSLFAASIASFTFITHFIEKASKRNSKIIFIFFSGILLGFVMFIALRIVYYGYLASGTLCFPKSLESYQNLRSFSDAVEEYVFEEYSLPGPLRSLMSHSGSIARIFYSPYDPFTGLLVSMYFGFFLGYLFFYAFSKEVLSRSKLWFTYFIGPAIIGLLGIFGYLEILKFSNFIWFLIFILWYVTGFVIICFF